MLMKVDGKENYADLMTKNTDGNTFKYLGNEFRDEHYYVLIIQKFGDMSRSMRYEVGEDNPLFGRLMKAIRRNGKLKYEREED